MKQKKNKKRTRCALCGARRLIENMTDGGQITDGQLVCKNNDMCVLKMSYIRKNKKK